MYELGDEREGVEMKSETKTALRWFGLSEGEESDEGWVRLAEVEGVPESRTMVIRHTQIGSCGCSRCPSRLVLAADHLQHSNHTVCLASYAIRQLHSYRYNVGTRRGIGQSRLMSACTRTTCKDCHRGNRMVVICMFYAYSLANHLVARLSTGSPFA